MGAWGPGPLENDSAGDFLIEAQLKDVKIVREILLSDPHAPSGGWCSYTEQMVLAAAELVAASVDAPSVHLDEESHAFSNLQWSNRTLVSTACSSSCIKRRCTSRRLIEARGIALAHWSAKPHATSLGEAPRPGLPGSGRFRHVDRIGLVPERGVRQSGVLVLGGRVRPVERAVFDYLSNTRLASRSTDSRWSRKVLFGSPRPSRWRARVMATYRRRPSSDWGSAPTDRRARPQNWLEPSTKTESNEAPFA